ncbi:MAG: hypothetical protein RL701_3025 [Pseudomonadota bacterium]
MVESTHTSFEQLLCCPRDRKPVKLHETPQRTRLMCPDGHAYPVIDGIPVMLLEESEHTLWVAKASLDAARAAPPAEGSLEALRLDTLGITPEQRSSLERLITKGSPIDPVAAMLVGATNGILYENLVGAISRYPIPELRLPDAPPNSPPDTNGTWLLDVGCNWGRWSIAAARKGYNVVGIDPSLGALLAARRVARSLGLSPHFVCADARQLPFRSAAFSAAFSYSVLQHFSKNDARQALRSIRSVMQPGATVLVQMPNWIGVRCLYHQARRKFRRANGFEVRYWTTRKLRNTFDTIFGTSQLETDCFFGLGLQASDKDLMSGPAAALIETSEVLRGVTQRVPWLSELADSVYLRARVTN